MSTYAVLSHKGIHYCLIPSGRLDDGPAYFEGGPGPHNVKLEDGRILDPARRPIPLERAIAIKEDDLWSASEHLITIKGWPVFALSMQALRTLPRELVDSVIEHMAVHWNAKAPEAQVQINWGGLQRTRKYKLSELASGVGAWPPRVIAGWKQYYFLFAPGTQALFQRDDALPMFRDKEPIVVGYRRTEDGKDRLIESECVPMENAKAAVCRLDAVPAALIFRSTKEGEATHGILPLSYDARGELRMPRRSDPVQSAFGRVWSLTEVAATAPTVRVAIDFGTSNTAIAWARASEEQALMSFGKGSRAVNLTHDVGLVPTPSAHLGLRFFPFDHDYPNPLPSTLIEFAGEGRCLKDTAIFPKRSIPGLELVDTDAIQSYAIQGYLKQDFKWKGTSEAREHRRAFFEHLALIVGWELWKERQQAAWKDVQLIFTAPLAFGGREIDNLLPAIRSFKEMLVMIGLPVAGIDTLISESYANLYFAKRRPRPDVTSTSSGRHVVIDIGGGTTDISIFTGDGIPLFLDSLYIGGKDIAESLLAYRVKEQRGWEPVAKALGLQKSAAPAVGREKIWTEMIQYLLITKMGAREGRGIADLAEAFSKASLRDLLGEIVTLLTFTTLYALRMAMLGSAAAEVRKRFGVTCNDVPQAKEIAVWYAGLGSRLFDLSPLQKKLDRWETAKDLLLDASRSLPELEGVEISFHREFGKESVCLGALDAMDVEKTGALDIETVWWVAVDRVGKEKVEWKTRYEGSEVAQIPDVALEAMSGQELAECFDDALRVVGAVTFEKNWRPDAQRLKRMPRDIRNRYIDGCKRIRNKERNMPRHPVRCVTDGLKVDVCELMEEKN